MPHLRWHDLRHLAASALIAESEGDVDHVSRVLGHASASITQSVYAHEFEKVERRSHARADGGGLREHAQRRCTLPRVADLNAHGGLPTPELSGLSIIVVGAFNPAILQPSWLAAKQLLRPEEAEAAEVEVITREIASFSTDWLDLAITLDRLQISTTSAPSYDLVRDLVVGIFTFLPETPVKAMGINRNSHYRVNTEETWHAFGDKLAPKDVWNAVLEKAGMRSLIMQGVRPDGRQGNIIVQVEPSLRLAEEGGFGVYIAINDHYQLDATDETTGADMKEVLEGVWTESVARAETIIDRLLREI